MMLTNQQVLEQIIQLHLSFIQEQYKKETLLLLAQERYLGPENPISDFLYSIRLPVATKEKRRGNGQNTAMGCSEYQQLQLPLTKNPSTEWSKSIITLLKTRHPKEVVLRIQATEHHGYKASVEIKEEYAGAIPVKEALHLYGNAVYEAMNKYITPKEWIMGADGKKRIPDVIAAYAFRQLIEDAKATNNN
ncbi:MAG: hypothetical protein QW594_01400 [Candidatus Woesearchaeota archaeon]